MSDPYSIDGAGIGSDVTSDPNVAAYTDPNYMPSGADPYGGFDSSIYDPGYYSSGTLGNLAQQAMTAGNFSGVPGDPNAAPAFQTTAAAVAGDPSRQLPQAGQASDQTTGSGGRTRSLTDDHIDQIFRQFANPQQTAAAANQTRNPWQFPSTQQYQQGADVLRQAMQSPQLPQGGGQVVPPIDPNEPSRANIPHPAYNPFITQQGDQAAPGGLPSFPPLENPQAGAGNNQFTGAAGTSPLVQDVVPQTPVRSISEPQTSPQAPYTEGTGAPGQGDQTSRQTGEYPGQAGQGGGGGRGGGQGGGQGPRSPIEQLIQQLLGRGGINNPLGRLAMMAMRRGMTGRGGGFPGRFGRFGGFPGRGFGGFRGFPGRGMPGRGFPGRGFAGRPPIGGARYFPPGGRRFRGGGFDDRFDTGQNGQDGQDPGQNGQYPGQNGQNPGQNTGQTGNAPNRGNAPSQTVPDGSGQAGGAPVPQYSAGGQSYPALYDPSRFQPAAGGAAAPGTPANAPRMSPQFVAQSRVAGSDTPPTQGYSSTMRQEGQPLASELSSNPRARLAVAAMASLENAADPLGPIEALRNRIAQARFNGQPMNLHQALLGGFYGPINRGQLAGAMRALQNNPGLLARYNQAIDAVVAGSNVLGGATDQGSFSDPNAGYAGGRVIRRNEVYNDYRRDGRWRMATQRRVRQENQLAQQ